MKCSEQMMTFNEIHAGESTSSRDLDPPPEAPPPSQGTKVVIFAILSIGQLQGS